MSDSTPTIGSPAELARALDATGYLADDGVAMAAFLAIRMGRPLFCEGEPGTGKTSLAAALSEAFGLPLIRLQCHEGIDAAQALYDWDFPRQLLHLRTLEAASDGTLEADTVERSLYTERFLLARPLLRALTEAPCVLLVDEIDRADDEFEAFLLQVLDENAVTIPELGEVRAATPPLVVLTSNRTREVHDALKRRCLYHWLEHPRSGAGGRDPAPPHPRNRGRTRRPGRPGRPLPARDGTAQAAGGGRVAGLGARTAGTRSGRAGRGDRRRDARRGPQVPRGPRTGGPGRTGPAPGGVRGVSTTPDSGDPLVGIAG
ncbi:MoxR family ATPase, partial [Rhodococcus wratislaviensis IFP 2016]